MGKKNKKRSAHGPCFSLLWGVIGFVAAAVVFGGPSLARYSRWRDSLTWPTVDGQIERVELVQYGVQTSRGARARSQIYVEYSYMIDDVVFTSESISYAHFDRDRVANTYREQDAVTVYVSPDDPRQSVLIQGHIDLIALNGLQIAFFALLIAFAALVGLIRCLVVNRKT